MSVPSILMVKHMFLLLLEYKYKDFSLLPKLPEVCSEIVDKMWKTPAF